MNKIKNKREKNSNTLIPMSCNNKIYSTNKCKESINSNVKNQK